MLIKSQISMKSALVRQVFLDYFKSKSHQIVASAPMVVKDDPTLMFTNAGMNQFKNLFLGNSPITYKRATDTQKCLRVSGKHNDLEEVGHDTYHHTMFEMLGNWSFGDYFKKEAIEWAWELITDVLKIDKECLYVTVFEGDKKDKLAPDNEAFDYWKKIIPEDQILFGSKKDNFWEMGDTGPCGPCSEIHIDIRSAEERAKKPGKELVNEDHPLVIEIWNLVFIEFNRKANGDLVSLPAKHVDTGMGFERLCMVLQGVQSNYDTDIFQPIIQKIASLSNLTYGKDEKNDIAMRVIADHLRAVTFAIADGQLPSNTGAGYVIRRILRRAVRYGYTFLKFDEPFIHQLIKILVDQMGDTFPELKSQEDLIRKVIAEEEQAFLRTLAHGIKKFENHLKTLNSKNIDGKFAFELFDTFGFPIDLTQLLAQEKGFKVDLDSYKKELQKQKDRSRNAAKKDTSDWISLIESNQETKFIGFTALEGSVKLIKYRQVSAKKKTFYEVVLDKTPFYAESGGQVGDQGYLIINGKKWTVIDTKKDNNLIIHILETFEEPELNKIQAYVNIHKRKLTENNHSATHLMHAALRKILGSHVEQKGSLVNAERLRFDFSHFSKVNENELKQIERLVNSTIRDNIQIEEFNHLSIDKAKEMGAMALFGEKYGDEVRVIRFGEDFSTELCGGTHVPATGNIGMFKIVSEGAIAAGIRRIEAVTADQAESFYQDKLELIAEISSILKEPKGLIKSIQNLINQNNSLNKQLELFKKEKVIQLKSQLMNEAQQIGNLKLITAKVDLDMSSIKDLAFSIIKASENTVLVLGSENGGKANLSIIISDDLIKSNGLHAGNLIRTIAKEIRGGGGGQPHFATAGGSNIQGIDAAFEALRKAL